MVPLRLKKKLFIKSLNTYFAVLKVEQPFYRMERWREVTFALDKCFVCSWTVILVICFVSFHSFDVRFDLECQFKDSSRIIVKHINCRCAKLTLTRNVSFINIRWSCLQGSFILLVMYSSHAWRTSRPQERLLEYMAYLSHRTFLQNICYNKDFEKRSKRFFLFLTHLQCSV